MQYRIKSDFLMGDHNYKAGDVVELDDRQATRLAHRIESINNKGLEAPVKDKMIKKTKTKGAIKS